MKRNYETKIPNELADYPTIGGGNAYINSKFNQGDFVGGAGWPTGNKPHRGHADWVVLDESQFITALSNAHKNDVIWIPDGVTLKLNQHTPLTIDTRVTIASNRGRMKRGEECEGGTIKVTNHPKPLFDIQANGTRVYGLRILGSQFKYIDWPGYDAGKHGTGVKVSADTVEVANCEIRGWGHAAVSVGREGFVKKTHIHHCDLVDNPMGGLGYGVTVFRGNPLIQYNYFNNNRHSVAGDGYKECSYVARYNFVGPVGSGHSFDMHAANENDSDKGGYAGNRFSIHHNVFKLTRDTRHGNSPEEAIAIRGEPLNGGQIMFNWFAHTPSLYANPGGQGAPIRVEVPSSFADAGIELGPDIDSNYYGKQSPMETVGVPQSIME